MQLYIKHADSEPEYAAELLVEWCRTDLELFAHVFFPDFCQHPFNAFHEDYFDCVVYGERRIRRAWAAPRGYAKSVLIALIRPIHDFCYGFEKFILFFSNTAELAYDKVKDVRDQLQTNDLLRSHFPIRFPTSKPGQTGFVAFVGKRACHFEAHGARTEVRGKRKGAHRPSKIICDDFEDSEEVQNEALRNKYEDRYFSVIGNLGDENTNIEFIGTVLHKQALLVKLLKNPAYTGRLYKSIIHFATNKTLWDEWEKIFQNVDNEKRKEDALAFFTANEPAMMEGVEVLWKEKEPYYNLMIEIMEKGWRPFQKEKQNNPINDDEAVFTKIHYYREEKEGFRIEETGVLVPFSHLGQACGAMDPATGKSKPQKGKKGDYAVIGTGYPQKGRLFVHHAWCERKPPTIYIKEIFNLHEKYQFSKFAVETNLYRELLLPNIIAERKRWEEAYRAKMKAQDKEIDDEERFFRIPFYEVENTENKRERITQLEPKVSHGFILFNRAINPVLMEMLENFPNADNDDGPDMLEMLWKLVNNFYRPSPLSISAQAGR